MHSPLHTPTQPLPTYKQPLNTCIRPHVVQTQRHVLLVLARRPHHTRTHPSNTLSFTPKRSSPGSSSRTRRWELRSRWTCTACRRTPSGRSSGHAWSQETVWTHSTTRSPSSSVRWGLDPLCPLARFQKPNLCKVRFFPSCVPFLPISCFFCYSCKLLFISLFPVSFLFPIYPYFSYFSFPVSYCFSPCHFLFLPFPPIFLFPVSPVFCFSFPFPVSCRFLFSIFFPRFSYSSYFLFLSHFLLLPIPPISAVSLFCQRQL